MKNHSNLWACAHFACALFAAAFFLPQPAPCKEAKSPLLLNLYGSAKVTLPENASTIEEAKQSKAQCADGLKLSFQGFEARLFNSAKNAPLSDYRAIKGLSSYNQVFNERRGSLSFDSASFENPLDISGRLAFGSLKLYGPSHLAGFSSTLSPFAQSLSDAQGFSVSLPVKTSKHQDDALFASARLGFTKNIGTDVFCLLPMHAEFFISKNPESPEKKPMALSFCGGFLWGNFLKVTGSALYRRYYFSAEDVFSTVWNEDIILKKTAMFHAGAACLTAEIPFLKSKTTFSMTENEYFSYRAALSQELAFSVGGFSLLAQAYLTDNYFKESQSPFLAGNLSDCKKIWQAKLVPEIKLNLWESSSITFGLGGFIEKKMNNFGKKDAHNSIEGKVSAGLKFSSKINSFKITASTAAFVLEREGAEEKDEGLPKLSATASFSHKFRQGKGGRISVSAGASFLKGKEPGKDEWTQKGTVYFYPNNFFVKSLGASVSLKQAAKKSTVSPTASAAFLLKLKQVHVNATVSVTGKIVG